MSFIMHGMAPDWNVDPSEVAASEQSPAVPLDKTARIAFEGVDKVFDGTHALRDVRFTIRAGEIHALLGANGAGKSTLIKVLSGYHKPDKGRVTVVPDGKRARHPVAFIHQDLALVPDLTVAENIALTLGFPRRLGAISWSRVRDAASKAMAFFAPEIDVDTKVGDLSRADQSLVAIARAVATDCSALVLDEPTASLPDADVDRLFEALARLKKRGVSILYVTHRLDEVRRIADHVTILRDGSVVVDERIDNVSDTQIVAAIVGSSGITAVARAGAMRDGAVLEIKGARVATGAAPFDLHLAPGEVLGLAGLRGSGQELVGRAVAGIERLACSELFVAGQRTTLSSAAAAISRGIGFATSRREQEALAMLMSAQENFYMNPNILRRRGLPFLSPAAERRDALALAEKVRLRPLRPEAPVANFSGGNQQKVVLGRWLSIDLRILVLEEPTIGIDVGARAEIYQLVHSLARNGLGVLVVSSDFEELAGICDRVLVFDRGTICADLSGPALTVDALTHHASGASKGSPSNG